ncbi:heterokaryon incompatibility, partial [Glonium stellatum]
YTALSYAWGNCDITQLITLNGRQSYITENLAIALRHMQHESEGLVLWIDSICINQQDGLEKAYQVQRMAKIYSSAAIVLAWLGPARDDSDLTMSK